MKSLRKLTPLFRLLFAALVVVIALMLLYRGASGPTNAQQSQPQERQIENTIPKHVPIDVKIAKEKEKNWKDLKNERWASDFEVEITNTGEKPIYTFGLSLYFDVPNEYQDYLRADIVYGRPEISRIGSKPTADDIPLKPGESKIFTLQPGDLRSFEKGRREKGWQLPTRVKIKVGNLNFGDGTGFVLGQPVSVPSRSPETSKLDNFNWQPRLHKRANRNSRSVTNDGRVEGQKNHTSLPAILPVSHFRADSTLTGRDVAIPVDECAPGCFPVNSVFEVPCVGCDPHNNYWYTTSGPCGFIEFSSPWCMDTGNGQLQPCTVTDAGICMSEPAPTPIPTATPSPTPPPVCYSCSSDAQCSCPNLHCNLNIGFCAGNYYYGCDEHLVDDCLWGIGYIPVGTCQCSHDYGYGGGGGGGTGCLNWDCSCWEWWECGSGICASDGYCREASVDPILIDINGNGFSVTDSASGVMFDFFRTGIKRQVSWTEPQSDDAWLALDWNNNGMIDDGSEMFSNITRQPQPPPSPIGFQALAMFDKRPFGGNSDGVIDQRDPIFRKIAPLARREP